MRSTRVPLFALLFSFSSLGVYAADRPALEVGGGFSSMASGGCCLPMTGSRPVGWYGTASVKPIDWLAFIAEVGGDYETLKPQPPPGFGTLPATRYAIYGFFGGPRVGWRATGRATLFGQALFGVAHRTAAASIPELSQDVLHSYVNQFAWQPGAGLDVAASNRITFRIQADYRLTPVEGSLSGHSQLRQPRFKAGIVLKH
jgi:hypothetical protein